MKAPGPVPETASCGGGVLCLVRTRDTHRQHPCAWGIMRLRGFFRAPRSGGGPHSRGFCANKYRRTTGSNTEPGCICRKPRRLTCLVWDSRSRATARMENRQFSRTLLYYACVSWLAESQPRALKWAESSGGVGIVSAGVPLEPSIVLFKKNDPKPQNAH